MKFFLNFYDFERILKFPKYFAELNENFRCDYLNLSKLITILTQ